MSPPPTRSLSEQLMTQYGPTMGGTDLYQALGYKTYAAFNRSRQRNVLGVKVFALPGRRGWFALTADIAAWLEEHASAYPGMQRIDAGSPDAERQSDDSDQ